MKIKNTYRYTKKLSGIHRRIDLVCDVSISVRKILQRSNFAIFGTFLLKSLHRFVECQCNAPYRIICERSLLVALRIAIVVDVEADISQSNV